MKILLPLVGVVVVVVVAAIFEVVDVAKLVL